MKITPVILSGGSGTRLWPLSTPEQPKQFLSLTDDQSMFQLTAERCSDKSLFEDPIIVGSARHADLAEEHLRALGMVPQCHILEPCARNTAPAIALAALACSDPTQCMLVMPSDHIIENPSAFLKAVSGAVALAQSRWLVTFGIKPAGPETGYGYIKQGEAIVGSSNGFAADRFVEKPNLANAEKMLADGGFYWNAGIFLLRADSFLDALEKHAPEMLAAVKAAHDAARIEDARLTPDAEKFAAAPSDSIDYAVMEKAGKVAVVPVNPGWSDVGSWDSLHDIATCDLDGNNLRGEVTAVDAENSLIHADGISVATYGVKDLIVVANDKQVMIIPRGQSQHVKKIIEQMAKDD